MVQYCVQLKKTAADESFQQAIEEVDCRCTMQELRSTKVIIGQWYDSMEIRTQRCFKRDSNTSTGMYPLSYEFHLNINSQGNVKNFDNSNLILVIPNTYFQIHDFQINGQLVILLELLQARQVRRLPHERSILQSKHNFTRCCRMPKTT